MTDFQLAPPEKDICKIHTDRSNKHLSRISTSKLSKEELEDLYYEIFENNVELKRVVNQQKQTINALNTKVLRMTATRKSPVSSNPCCIDSRVIIREQKGMIQELKLANEQLAEQIRRLKVQLCTQKQFTKVSPSQKSRTRPPLKVANNSSARNKNSETSVVVHYNNTNIRNKESEASLIIEVPQDRSEEKEPHSSRVTENGGDHREKGSPENTCTENKCVTQMEELKEKINNLEEELNSVQRSYNTRIVTLEEEICRLSKEEQAARASRAASQAALTRRHDEGKRLAAALRNMETHTNELSAQLQLEKMKVSDLEMQLKTHRISNNMFDIIEDYFNNRISKRKGSIEKSVLENNHNEGTEVYQVEKDTGDGSHRLTSSFSPKRSSVVEESLARANVGLCEKVLQLQAELDRLKVFIAGQEVTKPKIKYNSRSFDEETKDVVVDYTDDGCSTKIGSNIIADEHYIEQNNEGTELEENTSLTFERKEIDEVSKNSENGQTNNLEQSVARGNNKADINIIISNKDSRRGEQDEKLDGSKNPTNNSLLNTYTLKRETVEMKNSSTSPENTDYDVSSITDTSSSAKSAKAFLGHTRSLEITPRSPTEPLSLGENRELSSFTEYTMTSSEKSTTEKSLGYLSEGEIPSATGNFLLSCEWAAMKEKFKQENIVSNLQESKAEKLKAALQQIKQHLVQCKQLQASTKVGLQNSSDI